MTEGNDLARIFISHNARDVEFANDFCEKVRAQCSASPGILLSRDITAGKTWYHELRACLERTDWFILIMGKSAEKLDLCLYEAGIYEAARPGDGRLVCLKEPGSVTPSLMLDAYIVENTPSELDRLTKEIAADEDFEAMGSQGAARSNKRVSGVR